MKAPTYIYLVCITFYSIYFFYSYSHGLKVKNFLANFPTEREQVIISWWFFFVWRQEGGGVLIPNRLAGV